MEIKMANKGIFGTKLYMVFQGMKNRCYYRKSNAYKHYGEKGITICDEWLGDYKKFINWSLDNGYKEGLTIDRVDADKGYSPENCRWVTYKENILNRKYCHFVNYLGKSWPWRDICDKLGISKRGIEKTVRKKGISYQEAFDMRLNAFYNPHTKEWEKMV